MYYIVGSMPLARVTLLTSIPSPFWIEFCEACSRHEIEAELVVRDRVMAHRGRHWHSCDANATVCQVNDFRWRTIAPLFERFQPDLLIHGDFFRTRGVDVLLGARALGCMTGILSEQPLPAGILKSTIRDRVYGAYLRAAPVDLFWAIGPRAASAFRRHLSKMTDIQVWPYYQDLSRGLSLPKRTKHTCLGFVFLGQLVERNGIHVILDALQRLASTGASKFRMTWVAYGPLEQTVREHAARYSYMCSVVKEFDRWEDRLAVFDDSDLLLYPGRHSGWGLSIPEAMSAGVIPISTVGIESARFFIEPYRNGLIIEPNAEDLLSAIDFLAGNHEARENMAVEAQRSAIRGDANTGARMLANYLALQAFRRPRRFS